MATRSAEQEALIALVRTHNALMTRFNALLRDHGLTEPQFNVLRILRGAGKDGLPCGQISERMLTHLPDITRLLDRLEREGYVSRARLQDDRRVVVTKLTARGSRKLAKLDAPVEELTRVLFAGLKKSEVAELRRLLDTVRGE